MNDDGRPALHGPRAVLERMRDWWRAPHFLEKDAGVGIAVTLVGLVVAPPASPVQMLLALCWVVVMALLPFRPREVCLVAPVLFLASGFLPDGWWTGGGFAVIPVFLAVGYVLSDRMMIGLLAVYTVADAVCFTVLGTRSLVGGMVEGMIVGLGDAGFGAMIPADPSATMPGYAPIAGVATAVFDLLGLGFLIVLGAVFRRASAAGKRADRAERLLGRVAREQELAHMIHDSVANDMSTIAMLAWRAKSMDDDGEVLDAIYDRSHHALDRVHEVIDVLNGKRELADLMAEAGEGGAPVAGGEPGAESDAATAAKGGDVTFDTQLEKTIEDQNRTMTMLGLVGVTRFNCAPDVAVPKPVRHAVLGLVEEIYANIVRHCAMNVADDGAVGVIDGAGGAGSVGVGGTRRADEPAYSLFVEITADHIRISEVNAIADESKTLVHGRRHGGGLSLHRAAVAAVGGTLTTSSQDDTWMISADIPLTGTR